jgi:hypothetical protein
MVDESVLERINERSARLGRKLTARELIDVINEPDPDDHGDLDIVYDEDACQTQSSTNIS